MGDTCETVEADVVGTSMLLKCAPQSGAHRRQCIEIGLKVLHGLACGSEQYTHALKALGLVRITTLIDGTQTMMQRLDEHATALAMLDQIVLQMRIAAHHPDVAQHFIEHAR